MIEEGYNGEITDLYLSKPPVITLEFKGKEMGHWVLDRPVLNIGRTADNDIPIDNLAVSRLHAVLERDKGHYYIRDCDSLNGTLLNKRRVGRAKIQPGDEIMIGKHVLRVQKQAGMELPKPVDDAPFDRTVIINPGQIPQALQANKKSQQKTPARLVERRQEGDVIIELSKSSLVLGKDDTADIEIDGLFVADRHAEIVQENGNYVIRHLKGYRKVCVGGRSIRECVLKDNDEIKIGKREFVFQA
jgi:pSer/pThr/pTyr-binding forkhead associated (FHA) protein